MPPPKVPFMRLPRGTSFLRRLPVMPAKVAGHSRQGCPSFLRRLPVMPAILARHASGICPSSCPRFWPVMPAKAGISALLRAPVLLLRAKKRPLRSKNRPPFVWPSLCLSSCPLTRVFVQVLPEPVKGRYSRDFGPSCQRCLPVVMPAKAGISALLRAPVLLLRAKKRPLRSKNRPPFVGPSLCLSSCPLTKYSSRCFLILSRGSPFRQNDIGQ